jgi:hypothetical protein
MTTVIADWHEGIMVSDSQVSDQDRKWCQRKVFRVRGALLGIAGTLSQAEQFLTWYKAGCVDKPPTKLHEFQALVLTPNGLLHYDMTHLPVPVPSGREAIGSGAKAAMVGYELLGWQNARRVVRVVCNHDAGSRGPVRVYHL